MPSESSPVQESTPTFVVLPPAETASAASLPLPAVPSSGLPPSVQALARHPLVLAGGAVLAGVVLSRFLATPSARKIARELAEEAIKHLKPTAANAAGMAGTAMAGSLLEKGVEKYGPQIVDYGKKMLADLLRKKE